jgi:acyl carrier protein
MDVRSVVIATIKGVAEQQDVVLAPLEDALPLLETGLDSLCMAIIVAQLEDKLDVDPFDVEDDFVFPVTIGDFITVYEHAVAQPRT